MIKTKTKTENLLHSREIRAFARPHSQLITALRSGKTDILLWAQPVCLTSLQENSVVVSLTCLGFPAKANEQLESPLCPTTP